MTRYLAQLLPLTCLPLLSAAVPDASTYDVALPAGPNYARAAFRLWLPPKHSKVRAVVVLVPGSNGDGRSLVNDPDWQAFATRNACALVGSQLNDKPHPQPFIESYSDAAKGSGAAVLEALTQLSEAAARKDVAKAPLLLWGFSAGGQLSYELAAWRPERVAAFVANKGGVYFTALTSPGTRAVPALLFTGEQDLPSRKQIVEGLFALNRRAGALWALVREPGIGHEIGQSAALSRQFFEDALALRVSSEGELRAVPAGAGVTLDLDPQPSAAAKAENTSVWLPAERTASAWRNVVSGGRIGS